MTLYILGLEKQLLLCRTILLGIFTIGIITSSQNSFAIFFFFIWNLIYSFTVHSYIMSFSHNTLPIVHSYFLCFHHISSTKESPSYSHVLFFSFYYFDYLKISYMYILGSHSFFLSPSCPYQPSAFLLVFSQTHVCLFIRLFCGPTASNKGWLREQGQAVT